HVARVDARQAELSLLDEMYQQRHKETAARVFFTDADCAPNNLPQSQPVRESPNVVPACMCVAK
ncbi:MAG: hypothetical protein ACPHJ3_15705, partial [Rubripirellula sp.]